jgi:hypothetical protein
MKLPLLAALLCLLTSAVAPAQGEGGLLTTVGTTVRDGTARRAYLLWQPGEAATTLGKSFAVYHKAGAADAAGNYTRRGIQTLQTSPHTIRAMLELGARLDPGAGRLASRIDAMHRDATLGAGEAAATPLDSAGKLAFLIQSAAADSRLLGRLFFLGRAHPGVMLALGHAFEYKVPAGVHTFEVREVDAAGSDVQVVGRVTVDTAAPVVPAAPSAPFQVLHPVEAGSQFPISPKDHLNVRFRWGVGGVLRGQMPHTFGFDVYRVKRGVAEGLGWHVTPPAPAALSTALAAVDPANPDPDIAAANGTPVLVGELLDPVAAADPADRERVDFSDDGVWHDGAGGVQTRRPYSNGEQFYYFVAARTITGAPGLVSPGTLVTMCDRLPPNPPSIFSVTSDFVRPAAAADWVGQGGSQYLRVKIRQLPAGNPSDEATGYYVYRWSSAQEYLAHAGNPTFNRVGGLVAALPGSTFVTFNDNGAGAPTLATHADRAVWYTVRAVGRSACAGEVLSGHSAPVAGVLRDFKAPAAATGSFLVCRTLPSVTWVSRDELAADGTTSPKGFTGVTIEVRRTHPAIVEAEVTVEIPRYDRSMLVLRRERLAYRSGETVWLGVPQTEPLSDNNPMRITVRAFTANGLASAPVVKTTAALKPVAHVYHRFVAKTRKECNDVSVASPPVHEASDPDGIVDPIDGSISFPAGLGVKEWRVYRRVAPDGELSLIAKAEGNAIPNPGTWQDDALPAANGTEVCYYGQLFDQNGNPGPLTPLGCVTLAHPNLPTPMLSRAEVLGETAAGVRVKLEWFCDPVGVDRFEVLCAASGGGVPGLGGLSELLDTVPVTGISGSEPGLAFYPYQTARIGGSTLGAGPGFGLEVIVPVGKQVHFAVRACGPGEYPRSCGAVSNVMSAAWVPVAKGVQPVIPWPARPLPERVEHRLPIESYAAGEGPLWPIAMPTDAGFATGILIGLTRDRIERISTSLRGSTLVNSAVPPEKWLFGIRETIDDSSQLASLMPFMVYRHQLPSAAFPSARPNLVQCTPLIDRISWVRINTDKEQGYQVADPFLAFVSTAQTPIQVPFAGSWNDDTPPSLDLPSSLTNRPAYLAGTTGLIFVRDNLPVIRGAKYRHLLVQFDPRGEVKRVIPLQPVQH